MEIVLDKFIPRDYQRSFFEAMENSGNKYRNAIIVHPRKCGKDFMTFQYAIREALRSTTNILYMFKSYKQARDVIWEGMTNEGVRFLDTIAPELISSMNSSRLTITFKNNSMIKLGSAENYEKSIVGSNASLIIFSEYGTYTNDNAYLFASPILAPRNGKFIFISTPRGRNHYYDLWMKAQQWPDWYCELLTTDDTKHITPEMMTIIRREFSEEHIQQEYYCSFSRGIEGSVYANYINKLIDEERIGHVPYDPSLPVSTAWDLGHDDMTIIVLWQRTKNNLINVIDCYANNNQPIGHYIKWLKSQEYIYDHHWAPHDIDVHDYSTGMTRLEYARQLGLNFETREINKKLGSATPRKSVMDGIEAVRVAFSRISIDKTKCAKLIKALESYHREWDDEKKKYSDTMVHDWSSDYADAFRYMCLVIDMNRNSMTEADAHRGYNQVMFNNPNALAYPFNDDNNNLGRRFF